MSALALRKMLPDPAAPPAAYVEAGNGEDVGERRREIHAQMVRLNGDILDRAKAMRAAVESLPGPLPEDEIDVLIELTRDREQASRGFLEQYRKLLRSSETALARLARVKDTPGNRNLKRVLREQISGTKEDVEMNALICEAFRDARWALVRHAAAHTPAGDGAVISTPEEYLATVQHSKS